MPRSASPLSYAVGRNQPNHILHSTNSSGNDTTLKLNRLSTSSSLSIITPPTTPKRPLGGSNSGAPRGGSSTSRLKMALSVSLAQNFNQKLANLNDKWNDFSFLLLKTGGASSSTASGPSGVPSTSSATVAASTSARPNVRNDSYHSIESAVTCTAADFEQGNFLQHASETESNREFGVDDDGTTTGAVGKQQRGNAKSTDRRQRQRRRLKSSRRNSASGDPKEFDMLVLKTIDTGEDDNESF